MPVEEPRPAIGDLSPDRRRYWDGDVWQWQPLWLTPEEVIEAARQCFGRSVTTARFLSAGLLNQSWRVDADEGAYVLRVGRAERSREAVAYEHAFCRELNMQMSIVIPPLFGRDDESIQNWHGRLLSLFPFVEGIVDSDMNADERSRQAAIALAHIHRASLNDIRFDQRPDFRSVDERPRWVWPAIKPVLRQALASADDPDDLCDLFDQEITRLDAWLDGLCTSGRPLPRATVHGDFNARNLIFRDGRLVAVIDWDDCRVEPIAWEIAQVAFGLGSADPRLFWETYLGAGGPLAPEDFDLLDDFARAGVLSELRWTVKNGQATPHAIKQLREIATVLARF